jgi:hypothetical protein
MESSDIFAIFAGTQCEGCGGSKRRHNAFCSWCFHELPPGLKSSLYKRFGSGFRGSLSGLSELVSHASVPRLAPGEAEGVVGGRVVNPKVVEACVEMLIPIALIVWFLWRRRS